MVLDCRHWILLSSSCTLVWLGIEFIPLQTMSIYNKLQILHTKEIFTEGSWIFSRITASAWNLNSLVMSWDRWLCREKFKKRSVLFKLRILQAAYRNNSIKLISENFEEYRQVHSLESQLSLSRERGIWIQKSWGRWASNVESDSVCRPRALPGVSNGSISFSRRLHALMKMITWL